MLLPTWRAPEINSLRRPVRLLERFIRVAEWKVSTLAPDMPRVSPTTWERARRVAESSG